MIKDQYKIDLERRSRLGIVEAVWGENKTVEQIANILRGFQQASEVALVTRVDIDKAERLLEIFPSAKFYHQAKTLTLGEPINFCTKLGQVAILTGGTSDLAVASEAEIALKIHGVPTTVVMDVGVAGLHRLFGSLEKIKNSQVVIACAGMEGALPTVLTGLIPQPVIGVPISVGYGVGKGGIAALNGMLASCAPGLLVVNIDNGYGAAMASLRILRSKL